jgi:hypothetical protein
MEFLAYELLSTLYVKLAGSNPVLLSIKHEGRKAGIAVKSPCKFFKSADKLNCFEN